MKKIPKKYLIIGIIVGIFAWLWGGVLCVIGLFLAFFGTLIWLHQKRLREKCRVKIEGTVTDLKRYEKTVRGNRGRSTMTHVTYSPIYTYSVDGVVYKQEAPISKEEASAKSMIGKRVIVYFDSKNPNINYISQQKNNEYIGMALAAIGIVILIFVFGNAYGIIPEITTLF